MILAQPIGTTGLRRSHVGCLIVLHFTDYDTRLAAYALIIDERDQVLLSWFNGSTPGWTLPGGGVEYHEQLEEAVHREVYEETGYQVDLGEFLTTHAFTEPVSARTGRPYKSVRVIWTGRIVGGTLGTVEVDGTTDRAEWIPIADLPAAGERVELVDIALNAWRARA